MIRFDWDEDKNLKNQQKHGVSFANAVKGLQYSRSQPLFWHSPHARPYSTGDLNCTVVRDGQYKLIEWYDWKKVELYDIEKDISETNDLSEQMPAKTAELLAMIHDWRDQVSAYVDSDYRAWWTKQLVNRGDTITPEVTQLFDKYIKSE